VETHRWAGAGPLRISSTQDGQTTRYQLSPGGSVLATWDAQNHQHHQFRDPGGQLLWQASEGVATNPATESPPLYDTASWALDAHGHARGLIGSVSGQPTATWRWRTHFDAWGQPSTLTPDGEGGLSPGTAPVGPGYRGHWRRVPIS